MTPAIRLAEKEKIAFNVHPYEHDPDADSFGLEAAERLGVPAERVFKTLIAQVDGGKVVMALLPGSGRLDLKKLAAAAGGKKAELADPALAQRTTGYVIGGISPLGGKKKLPTFIDASLQEFATVFISAGQRGLQMEIQPADLVRLTDANLVDLCP